jgi:hypothetical protein
MGILSHGGVKTILDQLEQDLITLNLEEIQEYGKITGNAKFYLANHKGRLTMIWHSSLFSGEGWDYRQTGMRQGGWLGWYISQSDDIKKWFKGVFNTTTLETITRRVEQFRIGAIVNA